MIYRRKEKRPALWMLVAGARMLPQTPRSVPKEPREPRKRIKPVSSRQRAKLTGYAKVATAFRIAHPMCQACQRRGIRCPMPTEDIHHTRGRTGRLLTDDRYFLA